LGVEEDFWKRVELYYWKLYEEIELQNKVILLFEDYNNLKWYQDFDSTVKLLDFLWENYYAKGMLMFPLTVFNHLIRSNLITK